MVSCLVLKDGAKIGITKKPIRRGTAILPQMQYNVKGFFKICFYILMGVTFFALIIVSYMKFVVKGFVGVLLMYIKV